MCHSNACCPPAVIMQEELCGNFNGSGATVWSALAGDYIQGTFSIFNSAASSGSAAAGGTGITLVAAPGNTASQSVSNPSDFTITAAAGISGTWCITLYKRVLA